MKKTNKKIAVRAFETFISRNTLSGMVKTDSRIYFASISPLTESNKVFFYGQNTRYLIDTRNINL